MDFRMVYANKNIVFFIGEIDRKIKLIRNPSSNRHPAFKDWPLRNGLWRGGMEAQTV